MGTAPLNNHRNIVISGLNIINNAQTSARAAGGEIEENKSHKKCEAKTRCTILKMVYNKSDYRLVCVHTLQSRDYRYPPCNEEACTSVIMLCYIRWTKVLSGDPLSSHSKPKFDQIH